jgi:dihydroflavonol-4-reductase
MKALVTGGNGFIGANLARALVDAGVETRVLTRPDSDISGLDAVDCEQVIGDILDEASVIRAARGCGEIYHCAAIFAYHGYSAVELNRVAVEGTRSVLHAAARTRSKRVIVTSSSVVCGSSGSTRLRTEKDTIDEAGAPAYDYAKANQEREAFALGQELGVDVVAVCPTVSVGPHDARLSPSNGLIVRYLEDPLRCFYPGGCNVVSVVDVAKAHLLVARRGEPGKRYLVGADNLEWSLLYRYISELCGVCGPSTPVGHTGSYLMASAHELAGWLTGKQPLANRTQARTVGRFYWYDTRAIRALGFRPRSTRRALAEAIAWLATSRHISGELRRKLALSAEVWEARTRPISESAYGAI